MRNTSVVVYLSAALLAVPVVFAQSGIGPVTHSVSAANLRVGHPATRIASPFRLKVLAQGSDPLENPSGVITQYGYLNDFPPQPVEATKTEPDENTYLVFPKGLGGPISGYHYGHRFLFQSHEGGGDDRSYVTRINLDVKDPAHRITLLTPLGDDGLTHLNALDGSSYDPFTKTLLYTQETGFPQGGVVEITAAWPPVERRLDGVFGSAAYEGIHPDDRGNIYAAEDSGGVSVNVIPSDPTSPKNARQPNSFVYRFLPYNKHDLWQGGKLQALQVRIDGKAIVFNAADPSGDIFNDAQLKLHTPGTAFRTKWVTVHDTAVDGFDPFDSNAAAKAMLATPFKRPENLQFLPGSKYRTFFFCPTGDTSALSGNVADLSARGAWGSIFRVDMDHDRDSGWISIFFLGDSEHNSFDNLTFANRRTLLATEDRGDTLHKQLNALDSIWAFPLDGSEPLRLVGLGRDVQSENDVALADAATPGYQNEGDNEPTGLHISNGSTSKDEQPGTLDNLKDARGFFTQQHGANRTYEIVRKHE